MSSTYPAGPIIPSGIKSIGAMKYAMAIPSLPFSARGTFGINY